MVADVAVLVVGAGPIGLLLASELHRRRVECRVIDAHSVPLHWDRATVVHPRSLEVFESLGILEPLLVAGVKQRMARLHSGGNVLGEIDLSVCGSRYGFNIGISEEVVESMLTKYLHEKGGRSFGQPVSSNWRTTRTAFSRRSSVRVPRSRSWPGGW
jgi:2-polyprenyl-6-methoxyphenol hydroxylase-like FAD-dependent oxidoreductase